MHHVRRTYGGVEVELDTFLNMTLNYVSGKKAEMTTGHKTHLYQFYCLLHVSAIVKSCHHKLKKYIKKHNLNTIY
jgi:hypothetical protein